MFNANVFSVLALHIKSKMIIFTSELLQVSDFFSGKFCIQLCFCLENGWKSGKEMGLMIFNDLGEERAKLFFGNLEIKICTGKSSMTIGYGYFPESPNFTQCFDHHHHLDLLV